MPLELNVNFSDYPYITVNLGGGDYELEQTKPFEFTSPISEEDRKRVAWYLEKYANQYGADIDDKGAKEVVRQLPILGKALFDSVFNKDDEAKALFKEFHEADEQGRLLTITAEAPAILSLPWELLHDEHSFLIYDKPRISIRRRIIGRRKAFKAKAKDSLHLLFVVSRPSNAGFIDPRADPQAVLNALKKQAIGQVTVEFLRPATLSNLHERLEDEDLPPVDILHFDGHGVFDETGQLSAQAGFKTSAEDVKDSDTEVLEKFMGYLLFETATGTRDLVPATKIAQFLNQQRVGLVILSACQTAMLSSTQKDEASEPSQEDINSVAGRLTATGIPSVLAMTHSVLVPATQRLFESFYASLARGRKIGESLDIARLALAEHTERKEVQRFVEGEMRYLKLHLQDWFVPTLYQQGYDTALLKKQSSITVKASEKLNNLPELQEAGFFGRQFELWTIEQAFVHGTRRVTIQGFGGQGKTYLACEVGRWLLETNMFDAVVFVDYNAYQGTDAIRHLVNAVGDVFKKSFVDEVPMIEVLMKTPTLLILDNLELLKGEPLTHLLMAAVDWSTTGQSRVIITTRQAELPVKKHYPLKGSRQHIQLALGGLNTRDALIYFEHLIHLPPAPIQDIPERNDLIDLFDIVDNHALSINLLAQQLKRYVPEELGARLEKILEVLPDNMPQYEKSLLASLNLSLEKLDASVRRWLPRLGIFQGGAMEDMILKVTGLGKVDEDPEIAQARMLLKALDADDPMVIIRIVAQEMGQTIPEGAKLSKKEIRRFQQQILPSIKAQRETLAEIVAQHPELSLAEGVSEDTWHTVKQSLASTGLIQVESVIGGTVPYIKFHPTLAPVLERTLSDHDWAVLDLRHRQQYYQFSGYLYAEDKRNPYHIRDIVKRELPNLLYAVQGALDKEDAIAVEFVNNVNRFLDYFGLNRDRATLIARAEKLGGYLAMSNKGEQLYSQGRYAEARQVFETLLNDLGEQPSYEQCTTLHRLGRCFEGQGQTAQAIAYYQQGLSVASQLEQDKDVKRQTGALQTDLADTLMLSGNYDEARKAYESALAIDKELGDHRGVAVDNGQLGTLAMLQGNLEESIRLQREALAIFKKLHEPIEESVSWHQLGRVYQEAQQWEAAEHAYRESARIKESQGNLAGAARTWNQLALVTESTGKYTEAEAWYRKALDAFKTLKEKGSIAKVLNNLANLIQAHYDDSRLAEAKQLAEEALTIKETLDPAVSEIWATYHVLAEIAEKQRDKDGAAGYRRLRDETRK